MTKYEVQSPKELRLQDVPSQYDLGRIRSTLDRKLDSNHKNYNHEEDGLSYEDFLRDMKGKVENEISHRAARKFHQYAEEAEVFGYSQMFENRVATPNKRAHFEINGQKGVLEANPDFYQVALTDQDVEYNNI